MKLKLTNQKNLYRINHINIAMPFENFKGIKEREIFPGYKAKFIHSENMTFANWTIEEGASFPEHSHPHEQVLIMLEGDLEIKVGRETKILKSGDVSIIPPNMPHTGKAIKKVKAIDVFYPVRQDYV